MSKYVKNLVVEHIRGQLRNVNDALLVNMVGLDANSSHRLRSDLRSKKINVLVVKNGLAARAVDGTPLAGMFDGLAGSAAICWGAEDIVSLAKEIKKILADDKLKAFQARGGMIDGEAISAEEVVKVAKWPSRAEQLSMLVGQILSPGANLVSQLTSVGGALASQIAQRGEADEDAAVEGEAAATETGEAAAEGTATETAAASEPAPPTE